MRHTFPGRCAAAVNDAAPSMKSEINALRLFICPQTMIAIDATELEVDSLKVALHSDIRMPFHPSFISNQSVARGRVVNIHVIGIPQ
jgi:hypothetical protein